MRDRIIIEKELIPYSFDLLLGAYWVNLKINYNKTADLFTITLSKDNEVLVSGEPVIYGKVLFEDAYQSGIFPMLDIVPYDESGQETEVTWDNFNKTVFLTVQQGGDSS